jgi:ATP-dependent DNA helicase RecG
VQSGAAGIVVGTHAVIQEGVGFADLGLVVVDEQHRFGVRQRDELRSRPGETAPHLLVMTATPIPRTVALTLYGDLDVSVLDELPAGRQPIGTRAVPGGRPKWLARVWERVCEEVDAGHQAYVVCPRIGDDEPAPDDADAASGGADASEGEERRPPLGVLEVAELLAAGPLTGLRVEILHGRLPAEEKDDVMRRFGAGDVDVLVATTVVEVGVDVPNATAMVVLDAERFGVSQLHQLRGRVGRGSSPASCFLVTDAEAGSPAMTRLERIAEITDGFAMADLDLELRSEGDVLGTDQAGRVSTLRFLSVRRHGEEITEAREVARAVLEDDPALAHHPRLAGLVRAVVGDEGAQFLDRL